MWKLLDLIGLVFFLPTFAYCFSQHSNTSHNIDDPRVKSSLVEEIVRKVCNLSLITFSNKSPAEKAKLLVKIEEKLNKSAHAFGGKGDRYVQVIMKGVKSMAFSNHVAEFKSNDMEPDKTNALRQPEEPDKNEHINQTKTSKEKNKLVIDIARKIELLAKAYLKETKTKEERQKAIENIKKKFIESADRKHAMLHSKHQEIKNYVDLVGKGIELIMQKNAKSRISKRRRMEFVFTDNINVNKDRERNMDQFEPIRGNALYNNELDHGVNYATTKPKSVFLNVNKFNGFKSDFYNADGQNLPPTPKQPSVLFNSELYDTFRSETLCNESLIETCHKIKFVKTFRCQTNDNDNTEISIMKLCDGVGDCLDFSDERQCANHAIEVIQSASRLMKHIDVYLSHNCYSDLMHKSMLSKQSQILSDVLQNQLTFLHKHALQDSSQYSRKVFNSDAQTVKNIANEAVTVVVTLSSALESSLCSRLTETARKNGIDMFDDVTSTELKTQSPEVCKCNGQNCIMKTCSLRCEEICFEKYSLSQWQCSAVTGESLISLDMICDGKLDCYDETDEHGCSRDVSLVKFEATKMYEYILDTIKTKSTSTTFESVRNRLLNLHALITKLQKISLKRYSDTIEVKRIRDLTFAELMTIYDSAILNLLNPVDRVDMFAFLQSVNERIVSALKKSHTGNDKIIAPDGCVCRGYQCALPRCSKTCIRACTAEPTLTRFFCDGSTESNNSVPIELICNGKNNCPKGEDEIECKKEVCRAHHLVLLRHNLRDVGLVHQGTALGEALKSWAVKVTATLRVAESNDRPTPAVIRDIIHDVLHDLVMAYATTDDGRRIDTSVVLQEFYAWSRVVIDTLKSCGK